MTEKTLEYTNKVIHKASCTAGYNLPLPLSHAVCHKPYARASHHCLLCYFYGLRSFLFPGRLTGLKRPCLCLTLTRPRLANGDFISSGLSSSHHVGAPI